MSLRLKKLKEISNKYKFTVFGYIRSIENESLLNIPPIICYLCLGYYFHQDYFVSCDKYIKISEDKLTVTQVDSREFGSSSKNVGESRQVAFCHARIKSDIPQIVGWKFKITKTCTAGPWWRDRLGFCIRSADGITNECEFGSGYTRTSGAAREVERASIKFGNGDILTVLLHTKNALIGVKKNDDDIKTIWDQIKIHKKIRYRMSIVLRGIGDSVSLIDFKSALL